MYNPPVLRDGDVGEPVTVTVSPARSGDAYIEQAKRASGWVALYLVGWLWQKILCQLDLPSNCQNADTALEVLTDLLALVVFGVTQVSWACVRVCCTTTVCCDILIRLLQKVVVFVCLFLRLFAPF